MAGPVCRNAAVYWPGIEKSRAEGRRLLKEAGAESLSFQLLNRNVDQPLPGQADFLVPGMRTPTEAKLPQFGQNWDLVEPAVAAVFDGHEGCVKC